MENFEGEDMETQFQVLNYRIDLYFHDYKLTIEVDKRNHNDRNQEYEKQREQLIKKTSWILFLLE